ncbi:MAG TPA: CdaR family protein, partial [Bacilli bacterium]|nr:CdaR family protein [Bacilli bacterium]
AEVDVTDLKENKDYKVDSKKPVGVTYMSVSSISVSITLGTVAEKDLNNVRVISRNLKSGYSVSAASTADAIVTVNLKGVSSVVDVIKSDDVVAYIDLEGLTEGTHEVDVKIEGSDSRVIYTSKTKKVTVTITK